MSDRFTSCSIETLVQWILAEEQTGQIFGIARDLFFVPRPDHAFRIKRYGQALETPLGVAAGPHTQLAQNIISAWLTGARYLELKTIQTLDRLEVTKPCIDMRDEGYNCEWSQELTLDASLDEYLKAWVVLHLLRDKLGWQNAGPGPGFIFNMSVGYDLAGIHQPNVQRFLDRMHDCAADKRAMLDALAPVYPRIRRLDIGDRICDNVTISTMHGCPPEEIEKIGRYFIETRGLHTTIKLNPTLLGPRRLRRTLNQDLGFDVEVPDAAFDHDLKYDAAVALIRSLTRSAKKAGVDFNLKLTNTLETVNRDQDLPDGESMVYMSGRALHPVSIDLARRLQTDFDGALDISFCAGVDCFNVADVLACRLWPVTVCSDLLKPGGYGRLSQYLEEIDRAMGAAGARDLPALASARQGGDPVSAGLAHLTRYAGAAKADPRYAKPAFPFDHIKTSRELTPLDCIQAPCVTTCPASQDVPGYMHHTARGEYAQALAVIRDANPFPNVQGMVCDHMCQYKCTRMNYDQPLLIREIKRFAAQQAPPAKPVRPPSNGLRVAVIGAGPSGLSCAYFLARRGFQVDVHESKAMAGGMAADAIPLFRLDDERLQKDIDAIVDLGVRIHYGQAVTAQKFADLCQGHHYVYIAIGAQQGLRLGIPGEDAPGVFDQLDFLGAVRRGQTPDLGRQVVVVGGGNAAMDAARTAKRLVGSQGSVRVIYRRTRHEMPAEREEVQAAEAEGVEIVELAAPECLLVEGGRVTANVCFQMKLGEPDGSGRPRPMRIEGSEFKLEADSVITAIGQRVVLDFFPEKELRIDPRTLETSLENVFAGGDAVRGAASLIRAIADGRRAADSIARKAAAAHPDAGTLPPRQVDLARLQVRQARRVYGPVMPETDIDARTGFDLVVQTMDEAAARREAGRCLQCDTVCNVCTTVCPNRANIAFTVEPTEYTVYRAVRSGGKTVVQAGERRRVDQPHQIVNLADFCNECGNCATFCPTSGAPFQVKPRFCLSPDSFALETDAYLLHGKVLEARVAGEIHRLHADDGHLVYEGPRVTARMDPYTLAVVSARLMDESAEDVVLDHAPLMALLYRHVPSIPLFSSTSA